MGGAENVRDNGPFVDAIKGDGALDSSLDAYLGRLHDLLVDGLEID